MWCLFLGASAIACSICGYISMSGFEISICVAPEEEVCVYVSVFMQCRFVTRVYYELKFPNIMIDAGAWPCRASRFLPRYICVASGTWDRAIVRTSFRVARLQDCGPGPLCRLGGTVPQSRR
jgi:hypothetical protein